jgi:hypothetical protein
MYVVWFLIVITVLGVGFAYIGWRIVVPAQLSSPYNRIAWIALSLLFVIPVVAMILQRNGFEGWSERFAWVAYVGLGFLSFLLTFVLIKDIVWLAGIGGGKIFTFVRGLVDSSQSTSIPIDHERRRLLVNAINLGIIGAAGMLTGFGVYEARRRPSIVNVRIPIPNLPKDLQGFRIVQITDIHVGLTVKRDFVETIVEMANELKADLIAFTGDLADGSVHHLRRDVEPLKELHAPHGLYFVTGNHEYYSGVEQWVEEARRLGYTVMANEHRLVERGAGKILLAGVTDYTGGQFIASHVSDPAKAVEGAPVADVRILLAHQPRSLRDALPHRFDLLLTGHTHGGQFFPWNLVASLGQPYIQGLHKHEKTWIYVSKGTGYWGPPVRLAARSEITVIELADGDAARGLT